MEIVHITTCEVGDVIRYESSKKPYIVAARTSGGYFLFSKTQQYDSTINNFEVVRIIKGNGILPDRYENEELNQLLNGVKNYLKSKRIPSSYAGKNKKISLNQSSELLLSVLKRNMSFEKWSG